MDVGADVVAADVVADEGCSARTAKIKEKNYK